MRNPLAIIIAVLCLATPTVAAPDDGLQSRLEAMARKHAGKLALYATNLQTGQTLAIDADRPVSTASVIKLPILVEAMEQVKAGKLKLSDKLTLQEGDVVYGSGILPFFDTPLTLTFKDALTQMIIESDNTATNLVIDQVGLKSVNNRIAALGLKNTHLYKKVYKPATEPMPADQKIFGLGKTTAREMARVMESIVRCELNAPKLCDAMLHMLSNQQYRNGVPHDLETNDTSEEPSVIANKTGAVDQVRNDVAVVYSKAGPIIISAFTYDNQDKRWNSDNAGELLIAHVAKAIVDEWSPAGLAKEVPKSAGRQAP